jgi:hypothetical protein
VQTIAPLASYCVYVRLYIRGGVDLAFALLLLAIDNTSPCQVVICRSQHTLPGEVGRVTLP